MKNTIFNLKGKTALITGSSGHLGETFTETLLEAGAFVFLNARDLNKLNLQKKKLSRYKNHIFLLPFDLTQEDQISEAVLKIKSKCDTLDILVNNAFPSHSCHLNDLTSELFKRDFETSCLGSFLLINKTLPLLIRSGKKNKTGASIINISSMYGIVSPDPKIYNKNIPPNPLSYGIAKSGIIQMTKYYAAFLAKYKIRVNAISPGPFPKPILKKSNPLFLRQLEKKTLLGRIGKPEELKGPLLLLASDASSYMNGTNIIVDGGWTVI